MADIYCIENKINHKKYVGETIYSFRERWKGHLSTLKSPRERDLQRPLYKALEKYGIENFDIYLLEHCPDEQRFEREMYWIKTLDTVCWHNKGYNASLGGESGTSKITDEEFLEAYHSSNSQSEVAKKLNCEERLVSNRIKKLNLPKLKNKYCSKIDWENIKDDLISEYNNTDITIIDLAKKIEVDVDTLRKHFQEWGVKTIIKNKLFKTKEEKEEIINKFKELKSIKQTADYFNTSPQTITKILNDNGIYFNPHINSQIKSVSVIYEGVEYNFISQAEAARWVISQGWSSSTIDAIASNIGRVINGKRASYLGLVWKRKIN